MIVTTVGVGLLAGAAAAWYFIVQRPLAWPQTDATVVSSRVVNPKGPSDHQPEIVFHLEIDARTVATIASWSSSSYDVVRAYVDRYPPGSTHTVAVNPDNPNDVRYDLGASFANLILPGVLGGMGALFTGIGLFTLLARQPSGSVETSPATLARVSLLFLAIGVLIASIGAWSFTRETPLSWPAADAAAVESRVIQGRSSSSRSGSSSPVYDIQVTFSYTVDGTPFRSQTASGSSSSSRATAEGRLAAYSPGSRHTIRYRPDDPNVIAFEVARSKVYVLPGALLAIGVVFLAFGLMTRRMSRVSRT